MTVRISIRFSRVRSRSFRINRPIVFRRAASRRHRRRRTRFHHECLRYVNGINSSRYWSLWQPGKEDGLHLFFYFIICLLYQIFFFSWLYRYLFFCSSRRRVVLGFSRHHQIHFLFVGLFIYFFLYFLFLILSSPHTKRDQVPGRAHSTRAAVVVPLVAHLGRCSCNHQHQHHDISLLNSRKFLGLFARYRYYLFILFYLFHFDGVSHVI